MFEYEDFYETVTSLPETLQCPRCSATVPANPGVCTNCGEHVFQCHKCKYIDFLKYYFFLLIEDTDII